MKKKICLDIRSCQKSSRYTGVGIYAFQLSKTLFLLNNDFDIYFLALNGKELPWLIPSEKIIFVTRPSKPQSIQEFYDIFYLKRKLKKRGIQLYHSLTPGMILPDKDLKVIVTIHDIIPDIFPNEISNSLLAKISYFIKMKIASRANFIITNSQNTKFDLANRYKINLNKIKSIYLGSQFEENHISDFKLDNDITNNKFILYLGGFTFRKNLETLIESFSSISKIFLDVDLLIIGKPNKEQRYKYDSLIKKLEVPINRIKWLGFIDDYNLPFYYSKCEVFVYPSLYEGFGMPILEAMQFSAPIISSNRGAIPEVLGATPIKINPESSVEIANAITRVLNDKSYRIELKTIANNRSFNFSWNKCANETMQVYGNILTNI